MNIFKNLPPEIQEWLLSDEAAAATAAVAHEFSLSREQLLVLPSIVRRLITQNIQPEQFSATLAEEAGIDPELAKKITEALKEKVLAPIAQPLRFAGIDVDALNGEQSAKRKAQSVYNDEQSARHEAQSAQSVDKTPDALPQQPVAPFILHEEETASGPSFVFNPGEAPATSSAAPKVIIERVVHYSNLRTPLNQTTIPKKVGLPKTKWFV